MQSKLQSIQRRAQGALHSAHGMLGGTTSGGGGGDGATSLMSDGPLGPPTQTIGSRRYFVERTLGEGAFSTVMLLRDTETQQLFAGKRLSGAPELIKCVEREIDLMNRVKGCPFLVQCHDSQVVSLAGGRREVWIVMEACTGGSVVEEMQELEAKHMKFSPQHVLEIFTDVAHGIAFLHRFTPPISHRDIKVENILRDAAKGTYKLCDFGSATDKTYLCTNMKEVARAQEDIERSTTIAYRSPEAADPWQRHKIDEKQDVWALGVLLFYLLHFKLPFEDSNLSILGGQYNLAPTSDPVVEKMYSIIKQCFVMNPAQRPDVFTVLEAACALRGTKAQYARPSSVVVEQPAPPQPQPKLQQQPSFGDVAFPPVAPSSPQPPPATVTSPSSATSPASNLFDAGLDWFPSPTSTSAATSSARGPLSAQALSHLAPPRTSTTTTTSQCPTPATMGSTQPSPTTAFDNFFFDSPSATTPQGQSPRLPAFDPFNNTTNTNTTSNNNTMMMSSHGSATNFSSSGTPSPRPAGGGVGGVGGTSPSRGGGGVGSIMDAFNAGGPGLGGGYVKR